MRSRNQSMKASIKTKLESVVERFQELGVLLSDPAVINDTANFRNYSKEYANLEAISLIYQEYQAVIANINSLEEMSKDQDPEIAKMAAEELIAARAKLDMVTESLEWHLLPKDPEDDRNIYLEIRAGAGGDEASIFAGDLFRMYARYAESQGWTVETISTHEGEHGGFKEIVAHITGTEVYAKLKFESGTHRVQRIPLTESQGRVHTSTCTVAVLPEFEEIDSITIRPEELRIDTYRSSGAGGQHVNKTDSAIRITHLPTGVVVECQEERSQHKNRAKAMSLLQSRLLNEEQRKQKEQEAKTRKLQVGTGDRSERIRTYNFPQGRLTDHRINLTLYQLEDIIQGNLSPVIESLRKEHYAELLAELG